MWIRPALRLLPPSPPWGSSNNLHVPCASPPAPFVEEPAISPSLALPPQIMVSYIISTYTEGP